MGQAAPAGRPFAPACRFTGGIPELWADARYFLKLEVLDLHDNMLEVGEAGAPPTGRGWSATEWAGLTCP